MRKVTSAFAIFDIPEIFNSKHMKIIKHLSPPKTGQNSPLKKRQTNVFTFLIDKPLFKKFNMS
jgi:hypothetical protein